MKKQGTLALALLVSFTHLQAYQGSFTPKGLSTPAVSAVPFVAGIIGAGIAHFMCYYKAQDTYRGKDETCSDKSRVLSPVELEDTQRRARQRMSREATLNPITGENRIRYASLFGGGLAVVPVCASFFIAAATQVPYALVSLGVGSGISGYWLGYYLKHTLFSEKVTDYDTQHQVKKDDFKYNLNLLKGMSTIVTSVTLVTLVSLVNRWLNGI